MSGDGAPREYTKQEVSGHNSENDLWLIVNDKVYDMTNYYFQHPGGNAMLRQAGKDASLAIRSVDAHGMPWKYIEKTLAKHCIGVLKK